MAGQPVVTGNETHPVGNPDHWLVTRNTDGSWNCETCQESDGTHNNCIKGYVYDCKWDNYHIHMRCRPKTGYTEWINKDFKNSTGEDRNDLHWYIDGGIVDKVVEVYKPAELPHIEFVGTGSPATTEVRWSGGTVSDGTTVHCGIKVNWGDKNNRKKFTQPPHWTLDGVVREEVAGCGLTDFTFTDSTVLVDVSNTLSPESPPLEVNQFAYAFLIDPVELPDLTWNNPMIPWTHTPWQGVVPPGGLLPLGIIPENHPGQYLVIQFAANFAGDPPLNAGHIIMQVAAEAAVPAVSAWGLLIMALAVVIGGSIVAGRRKMATR